MYAITKIEWIGYEEANVEFYDGKYHVKCFCHPCHHRIGDKLDELIFCMFADHVVKIDEKYEIIQNGEENVLCGRVVDPQNKIFQIGGFSFSIEAMPGDICEGDFIEVTCCRISV